jgi:hypothetical protein
MSAKKSDTAVAEPPVGPRGWRSLLRANAGWILFVGVFVAICVVGWKLLWDQVREQVLSAADYRLEAGQIEMTTLPPWIHTDPEKFKSDVLRDGSLDGELSLLDKELTVRMAKAFAMHPWVAKVQRVSKRSPAGVMVDLTFRRPVAMVVQTAGLLPVDVAGVLLPTDDFSPVDAQGYLRISEIKTSPPGLVGTRWNDTHVTGAAQIAAALLEDWQKLKLHQIVPAARQVDAAGTETDTYELYTPGRTCVETCVDWGRPPGAEVGTEAKASKKIERLRSYAAEHGGSIEDPKAPARLDVRSASSLTVTPRRPIQPLPEAGPTK